MQPDSLFEAILNIAADAIISIDEQQNIVHYNQGAETIFGWTAAEAVGKPLDMLIPERFRVTHKLHVVHFGASHDVARRMGHRREISGVRKNGEEFPAEASISKLDTTAGRLYTVVLRDMSERKRIEEDQKLLANAGAALARSLDIESTFRTLVQLPIPALAEFCVLDVIEPKDTGNDAITARIGRRITSSHANPMLNAHLRALESLGSPLPGYPSLPAAALAKGGPLIIEKISEEWLKANTDTERFNILRQMQAQSLISVPLAARGNVLGVLTLATLPGGRHYSTDDLGLVDAFASLAAFAIDNARLYNNAQFANRARDEILGVVSHDLQNPVSAIAMCAQALFDLPDGKETNRRELASAIREATKWMMRMIRDLLDVATIESGKLSIEFRAEEIVPIVQSAVAMSEAQAQERSIIIKPELSAHLPQVYADAERIGQCLANLISNSIKFASSGSVVRVHAEAVGEDVVFSVSDTGPGISKQDLPHIFNRYWQSRQSARRPGAGLGLAIVKGIVEAHDGRLWVDSQPGQGSTFFFSIPRSM